MGAYQRYYLRCVAMNHYYFDPGRKALVCRYCGSEFRDYLSINNHIKEMHYNLIAPERVRE